MTVQELVRGADYLKPTDIYYPEIETVSKAKAGYFVPHIELDRVQAKEQGWHYKSKAGRKCRITRYTGREREVVVPFRIDGHIVNEVGREAFAAADVDIVFLPDSIKRIGEGCFAESNIRRALLPDTVWELPEKCFASCRRLESVRLPKSLGMIGAQAFMYCEKLKTIRVPDTLTFQGDESFRGSGIEHIIMRNGWRPGNGSCFRDTPIHRKYSIIMMNRASDPNLYNVVLVGSMKTVRFPEGSSVLFKNGSIQHGCTLDLSRCSSVEFEYDAFSSQRNRSGFFSSHVMAKVILPFGVKVCLPTYVDAYYPDGSKYADISWFTNIRIKDGTASMIPMKRQLPPYCFNEAVFGRPKITDLELGENDEYTMLYSDNAIDSFMLENVTFRQRLSGNGRLFTDHCRWLESVTIKEHTVYLPVCDQEAHKYLLRAFCFKAGNAPCTCFDSGVFDTVFTQPPKSWFGAGKKRLSQKTLIMLAVDVLRSSPELFRNRAMYEKYLTTHKRYAQLICAKLPLKYSEYLTKYYSPAVKANARRGFMPTDERDFSGKMLPILRKSAEEVHYLINRGYPVTSTTRFIGDHYQLSERQRLALARTISSTDSIKARKSRQVNDISGDTIYIDGFNVIIGLEIAYSQSMLFRCMDGTVRDLAGLHGTYRLIPQTDLAIKALLEALSDLEVSKAVIYLDKPVSNSGRLKQRIFEFSDNVPFELEVLTEDAVDSILKTKPLIASADAIILDECDKWFNLNRYIVDNYIGSYPYIDIVPEPTE